jgi:hypothetical protein
MFAVEHEAHARQVRNLGVVFFPIYPLQRFFLPEGRSSMGPTKVDVNRTCRGIAYPEAMRDTWTIGFSSMMRKLSQVPWRHHES